MDWNAVSAIAGVFAAIFVALTAVYIHIGSDQEKHASHELTDLLPRHFRTRGDGGHHWQG